MNKQRIAAALLISTGVGLLFLPLAGRGMEGPSGLRLFLVWLKTEPGLAAWLAAAACALMASALFALLGTEAKSVAGCLLTAAFGAVSLPLLLRRGLNAAPGWGCFGACALVVIGACTACAALKDTYWGRHLRYAGSGRFSGGRKSDVQMHTVLYLALASAALVLIGALLLWGPLGGANIDGRMLAARLEASLPREQEPPTLDWNEEATFAAEEPAQEEELPSWTYAAEEPAQQEEPEVYLPPMEESEQKSYARATGNVYLRRGPGKSYGTLSVIHKGKRAAYLGEQRDDERGVTWYHVRYDGREGWASSRYMELE